VDNQTRKALFTPLLAVDNVTCLFTTGEGRVFVLDFCCIRGYFSI